jgi:hypothetical protein
MKKEKQIDVNCTLEGFGCGNQRAGHDVGD